MLISGHYGLSSTFDLATMARDAGNGRELGDGAYIKPAGISAGQGTVYVVAGNAGKATSWTGGSTADQNPNPHPVMTTSLLRRGSVVLDVNGGRLDVLMLHETGRVDDRFTLVKQTPNTPPTVSLIGPVAATHVPAPGTFVIETATTDPDGQVVQMDFYADGLLLGTDTSAPFAMTWTEVPVGSYSLTAVALDDRGATAVSDAVIVTVDAPPPPAAPTGLSAVAQVGRVDVAWSSVDTATSYAVMRSDAGGAFVVIAFGLAGTAYADTAVTSGSTYCYQVTASGNGGTSAASVSVCATVPLPALLIPAAPTQLKITGATRNKITVKWTDNATNETGYEIYRSTNGTSWTRISTSAANTTVYTAGSLKTKTTYYFRVRAINSAGASTYSNTVTGKTL
jgi:hypothetical protein